MYFSTEPPKRSISAWTRALYGSKRRCTSSGSDISDVAVNPARSQKRIVTNLRSSRFGSPGGVATGDPHSRQNLAPSGRSTPQDGHPVTA